MIEEADRDGDGEISEDEFMRIMRKTNLFWVSDKRIGGAFLRGLTLTAITEVWNLEKYKKSNEKEKRQRRDEYRMVSTSFFITWIK